MCYRKDKKNSYFSKRALIFISIRISNIVKLQILEYRICVCTLCLLPRLSSNVIERHTSYCPKQEMQVHIWHIPMIKLSTVEDGSEALERIESVATSLRHSLVLFGSAPCKSQTLTLTHPYNHTPTQRRDTQGEKHTQTLTHSNTQTRPQPHTHRQKHTDTHQDKDSHTYTHTHKHTQTHT